jgi:hypothetical protein
VVATRSEITANAEGREQIKVFENLRDRTFEVMQRFGEPDYQPHKSQGDFSVHGDYDGYPEVVVFVGNLQMLRPAAVTALQELIREFHGWQITMTVAVRGHYEDWPRMGLYIRPHEIVDGLQRQYFPKEYQNLEYEGAKPGTVND